MLLAYNASIYSNLEDYQNRKQNAHWLWMYMHVKKWWQPQFHLITKSHGQELVSWLLLPSENNATYIAPICSNHWHCELQIHCMFPLFHIIARQHFPLALCLKLMSIMLCLLAMTLSKLFIRSALSVDFFNFSTKFGRCTLYPEVPSSTEIMVLKNIWQYISNFGAN